MLLSYLLYKQRQYEQLKELRRFVCVGEDDPEVFESEGMFSFRLHFSRFMALTHLFKIYRATSGKYADNGKCFWQKCN